jgi:hypothetical protein
MNKDGSSVPGQGMKPGTPNQDGLPNIVLVLVTMRGWYTLLDIKLSLKHEMFCLEFAW